MNNRLKLGNADIMKYMTVTLGNENIYLGMEMMDTFKVIKNWVKSYPAFKAIGVEIATKIDSSKTISERYLLVQAKGNNLAAFKFTRPVKNDGKKLEKSTNLYLTGIRLNINNIMGMLQYHYNITTDVLINWIVSCGKTNADECKQIVDILSSIKCCGYKIVTSKVLMDNLKSVNIPVFKNKAVHWTGTNSINCQLYLDEATENKVGYKYKLCFNIFMPIATSVDFKKERQFIAEFDMSAENIYDFKNNITCS